MVILWFNDVLGDSSVWDSKGYMVHYDPEDTDLRAFMQDEDGNLTLMGELGGTIDANTWFPNLLSENAEEADDIWAINPWGFKNRVKKDAKWDYKYRSPTNEDDEDKDMPYHIIGIAFYRSDKERGKGDLQKTYFIFNNYAGRPQDLNNLHFGVVGKAYGLFSETYMLQAAGAAEMGKWRNEYGKDVPASWRPVVGYYSQCTPTSSFSVSYNCVQKPILGYPYGDNPIDAGWIQRGFLYYDKNW